MLLKATSGSLDAGNRVCGECHYYKEVQGGVPEAIVLPKVPEVWFKRAVFDHSAHRAVHCRECHANASDSKSGNDVLLPKIEVCRECHSPARVSKGQQKGGARFDCVECHRYHNRDNNALANRREWVQGVGAHARDAAQEFDIQQFLSGPASGSNSVEQ